MGLLYEDATSLGTGVVVGNVEGEGGRGVWGGGINLQVLLEVFDKVEGGSPGEDYSLNRGVCGEEAEDIVGFAGEEGKGG